MIFETKRGKVFRGIQINIYRYNLRINESCFAVRLVLDNEEEYILAHRSGKKKAAKACSNFNHIFGIKTHYIRVTRVSETEYEYEVCATDPTRSIPGTPYGKFTQKLIDYYDISSYERYVHNKASIPDDYEKPDEFTIGASYLAEECRYDNPIFNDEFTIGASFCSSDFYEYNMKRHKK